MHEISLAEHIINTLKAEFPKDMENLAGIYLTVGELSNIQPTLMENAFYAVLEEEKWPTKIQLHIEVLPILIHCKDCKINSEIKQYKFVCQQCGQASDNIIQGKELLINKAEFAT